MKKVGLIVMIVGIVLLIIGIYGFIKVGSNGALYDGLMALAGEFGEKPQGFEFFAASNRVWMTIVGLLGTIGGIVMMKLKKY